jgi:hypothetical protein
MDRISPKSDASREPWAPADAIKAEEAVNQSDIEFQPDALKLTVAAAPPEADVTSAREAKSGCPSRSDSISAADLAAELDT